jgi:hypothetical protein
MYVFHLFVTFHFCLYFIPSIIIMAKKKVVCKNGKAAAPAAKAKSKASVTESTKKLGSIHQSSSAKAPMDTSSGYTSDSSVSSTHDGVDCDFIPTTLPSGNITIPSKVKRDFKETLEVMSKIDFSTLSNAKSIEWNMSLSQSCRRLSHEYSRLMNHLSLLQESDIEKKKTVAMEVFAHAKYPLIKKHSHDLFIKMPFPSTLEVTTTNGKSLSIFGLTSACPIATIVFDDLLFKPQGSSAKDSISTDDQPSTQPRHEYDSPSIRAELWVNHGIGTWTVKELGHIRNTVTNLIRDVLRKWLCLLTIFCCTRLSPLPIPCIFFDFSQ